MNKWDEYFRIVTIENPKRSGERWTIDFDEPYELYELHDPTGKVVATYKDFRYAKKQAKFRFKKLQAKLEKILLA